MDIVIVAILAVLGGLVLGAISGYFGRRVIAGKGLDAAQSKAAQVSEDAREQQRAILIEAKEEALTIRSAGEAPLPETPPQPFAPVPEAPGAPAAASPAPRDAAGEAMDVMARIESHLEGAEFTGGPSASAVQEATGRTAPVTSTVASPRLAWPEVELPRELADHIRSSSPGTTTQALPNLPEGNWPFQGPSRGLWASFTLFSILLLVVGAWNPLGEGGGPFLLIASSAMLVLGTLAALVDTFGGFRIDSSALWRTSLVAPIRAVWPTIQSAEVRLVPFPGLGILSRWYTRIEFRFRRKDGSSFTLRIPVAFDRVCLSEFDHFKTHLKIALMSYGVELIRTDAGEER